MAVVICCFTTAQLLLLIYSTKQVTQANTQEQLLIETSNCSVFALLTSGETNEAERKLYTENNSAAMKVALLVALKLNCCSRNCR